jgi:hypothetical protein
MNATMCFAQVILLRHSVIYTIKNFTETILKFISNKETGEVERTWESLSLNNRYYRVFRSFNCSAIMMYLNKENIFNTSVYAIS